MDRSSFESLAFYQAVTLAERTAFLHAVGDKMLNAEVNTDLIEKRLRRWRSQPPFHQDSYFAQRLATDGVTEDEFRYLLSEPTESINKRFPNPPAWLMKLAQAFSRPTTSNSIPLPEVVHDGEMAEFLDAIEPLISQGRHRLHKEIQALIHIQSELPFNSNTIEEVLLANLLESLLIMLSRTLVLELHVARLQGFLKGDTAEERFNNFLQHLHQPSATLALLQEYPVLARQLTIEIDRWVSFSLEFLHHLCADWEAIRTTFSPENAPGVLVQLDGNAGDSHRGGRAVLIATFKSGFQVVYKPKSLTIDVHFQELLTWINHRGNHPPFRTLKVLDRSTYGWVEFVAAQNCTSSEDVHRFYQRQGGFLALLYALEATDFHSENLIAAGEHPVLIDLESLFQTRIGGFDTNSSDQLATSTAYHSVLRVGLLPGRLWSNAESEGIDISGLGAKADQLTPERVPYWERVGTDEMRLKRERMRQPGDQNRPTLNGIEIDVPDYAEAIVAGFTTIYCLLLKHRNELLSKDGPLAPFAEDEVRFIVRPTHIYAQLLYESFHPNLLRNALERDQFFDRLWIGIEQHPYLAKVISAEREDLWQGDIPMFTTRPSSRDIWSSSNDRIANFFDEPGMLLVRRRLQQLSDANLMQQLWFIRASLATLAMGEDRSQWSSYLVTEPQTSANREQLVSAAQAVGDRLEALALRGEHDVTWIGLTLINERYWSIAPLGTDVYDGMPGIALFLGYLGAIAQEERYTALARAALTTMRRQIEVNKSFITSIGGFDGWGGIIYTLTHLGVLWNEPTLLIEAEILVELLPHLISQDENLDIIGGAAGCIGSLISLYRYRPSQPTLAAAIQCGDRIISQVQTMEHGVGWLPKDRGKKPLAGFSHGAAGIAWALLELASLTGEKRFKTTALAAIEYERSVFCPEVGNWPDLRDFSNSIMADKDNNLPNCMTAWCHGAPGIGLARLRSLSYLDDDKIRNEIDTAIKTTLAHGFGSNHSLCHGDLGNLELLLQASLTLDNPLLHHQVNRFASIILESIEQHGWLCGVPLEVETPGLMTGLAGIGYELLRLAEPKRVPSVLVLEPPMNIPSMKSVAERIT